jgi:hypothetical protein
VSSPPDVLKCKLGRLKMEVSAGGGYSGSPYQPGESQPSDPLTEMEHEVNIDAPFVAARAAGRRLRGSLGGRPHNRVLMSPLLERVVLARKHLPLNAYRKGLSQMTHQPLHGSAYGRTQCTPA